MITLSIVLGLTLFALTAFIVLVHTARVGRVLLIDWAVLAFGGVYGLGWVFLLVTVQSQSGILGEWIQQSREIYPLHTVAAILSLAGVLLGWYLAPFRLMSQPALRKGMSLVSERRRWRQLAWALLFLGLFAQLAYTSALGGPLEALEYSRMIRSGFFVENPWSFLRPLGGFVMISAFVFFAVIVSGDRRYLTYCGGLLAVLLSAFVLHGWFGRVGFVFFVATFPLGMLLMNRRNPMKPIFLGAIILAAALIGAYGISIWLDLKPAENLIVFVSRELAFPFASFFAQWSEGGQLFRLFVDFIASPLYILPSSIWASWLETASEANTALVMGSPKGAGYHSSGIPTDLITLGILQFNVLGIFLVGVMFGAMLRGLQAIIDRIALAEVRGIFEAHVALKIGVLGVFYAQPDHVISSNFTLIASGALAFIFLNWSRLKFGISHVSSGR